MKKLGPMLLVVALLGINAAIVTMWMSAVKERDERAYASTKPRLVEEPAPAPELPPAGTSPAAAKDESGGPAQAAAIRQTGPDRPAIREAVVRLGDETYKYIGETRDGRADGQGTAYYKSGKKRYEGLFRDGKPLFVGTSYYENGKTKAVGKLEGGTISTVSYNEDGKVVAELSHKDGQTTGQGKHYFDDGTLLYTGAVHAETGMPEGKGTEYHPNGALRYKGGYKNGKYNGTGQFVTDDGLETYEGQFKNGEMDGKGKFYKEGKLIYDGDTKKGLYHGQGKFYMNGSLAYEGDFVDGEISGQGKMYDNGKLAYEGEFKQNMPTGNGINHLNDNRVEVNISISPASRRSQGTFNLPAGVRVPSYYEVREAQAKREMANRQQ